MKREKETVIIGTKKPRSNLSLPKETSELLKSLSLQQRKAYVIRLIKEGWTLQSIASAIGVTRESVRLYGKTPMADIEEAVKEVSNLPIPNVPVVDVYRTRVKRVKLEPDVIDQLKELHAKATLVRSSSKKFRKEAEDFTKLAWEQTQRGVSTYAIAKAIGITTSALFFRFVRYGYKTSNGKSRVFQKVEHRVKETENK